MGKTTYIYFVTWPDGKIMADTPKPISRDMAIARALETFLPTRFFPGLNLSGNIGTPAELWRSMEKAGFKSHQIGTDATGVSY